MKRWLLAGGSLLLCVVCAWLGMNATQNAVLAWAGAVVFLICFIRIMRKGVPKHAADIDGDEPTSAPASPRYKFVTFNVAGTTFDTEGVSRQTILRKIKFGDAPFENSDSLEVALRPSTYEGSPCIECRVNDVLIGYVPKTRISEVMQALKMNGARISAFDVVGGGERDGEKMNYGAQVVVRYEI